MDNRNNEFIDIESNSVSPTNTIPVVDYSAPMQDNYSEIIDVVPQSSVTTPSMNYSAPLDMPGQALNQSYGMPISQDSSIAPMQDNYSEIIDVVPQSPVTTPSMNYSAPLDMPQQATNQSYGMPISQDSQIAPLQDNYNEIIDVVPQSSVTIPSMNYSAPLDTPQQATNQANEVVYSQINTDTSQNNFDYNFNFETQTITENGMSQQPQANDSLNLPLNQQSLIKNDINIHNEQNNVQEKKVDHELLKNLAEDTKNLVNPNMMISPIGNNEVESEKIVEPKVDYDEIQNKKNLMLIGLIFVVLIGFILLLPKISAIIGI